MPPSASRSTKQPYPTAVFDLLVKILPHCPNLKFVVLEQLGTALQTPESHEAFRSDFDRMEQIIRQFNTTARQAPYLDFLPVNRFMAATPPESTLLHEQQQTLSRILETAPDPVTAQQWLNESMLAHSDWKIEQWQPQMLETALAIAQKWK